MVQTLLPSFDIDVGLWTPTPLWTRINAIEQPDEWVTTPEFPESEAFEVLLTTAEFEEPFAGDHTFTVRLKSSAQGGSPSSGSSSSGATGPADVTLLLLQGSTVIATRIVQPTDYYVEFPFTLTQQEVDSITEYNDLRLRVVASVAQSSVSSLSSESSAPSASSTSSASSAPSASSASSTLSTSSAPSASSASSTSSLPAGALMSLEKLTILSTDSGFKTFSGLDLQGTTPQCGVIFGVKRQAGGVTNGDADIGIGFAGVGKQSAVCLSGKDAQSNWDVAGGYNDSASFVLFTAGDNTIDVLIQWKSAAANSLTLNIVESPSVDIDLYALLFSGLDDYAAIESSIGDTTAAQDFDSLSFDPDTVFLFSPGPNVSPGTQFAGSIGFGNSTETCSIGWNSNEASKDVARAMKSGNILAIPQADASDTYEQWTFGLISNGIRLQKAINSGQDIQFSALCLKGLSSAIHSVTEPLDTPATVTLPSLGFDAGALIDLHIGQLGETDAAAGTWVSVGAATGVDGAHHASVEFSHATVSTSDTVQASRDDELTALYNAAPALVSEAHLNSLGDTPQYDFTTASPSPFAFRHFAIALGPASPASGSSASSDSSSSASSASSLPTGVVTSVEKLTILSTDSGFKTFSSLNMQGTTPQCGVIIGVKRQAGGATNGDADIGIGFTGVGKQSAVCLSAEDGEKNWNVAGGYNDSASFILFTAGDNTRDMLIQWKSAAANSLTLNVVESPSVNVDLYAVLFSGLDDFAAIESSIGNTTAAQDFDSLDFDPDAVFLLSPGPNVSPGTQFAGSFGFGNSSESCSIGWNSNESAEKVARAMKSGKVLAIPKADATGIYEQWTLGLITNGIRLQKTTNSGDTVQFSALCLKGLSSDVQTVTEPLDTPATVSLSSLGFDAKAVVDLHIGQLGETDAVAATWVCVGAASGVDGANHASVQFIHSTPATSDTVQSSRDDELTALYNVTPALVSEAHLNSLGDTPEYDFTTAAPSPFAFVHFAISLG